MTAAIPTDLASTSDGVISRAQLRAAGLSGYAVSARCRPSGPWQRVLPGVVLMSHHPPTRHQWLRAAVTYAGPGAMITGADAIRLHGVDVPRPDDVLLLLPARRRATSRSRLTVERTTRLPKAIWRDNLPLAPLPRATIDAARHEHDRDRLHTLLLTPITTGACTLTELLTELSTGNQRGTAAPRSLLLTWINTPPQPTRLPLTPHPTIHNRPPHRDESLSRREPSGTPRQMSIPAHSGQRNGLTPRHSNHPAPSGRTNPISKDLYGNFPQWTPTEVASPIRQRTSRSAGVPPVGARTVAGSRSSTRSS